MKGKNKTKLFHTISKEEFQVLWPIENSLECVLNANETILKKTNVSFIVCLGKYSFNIDTFWIHLMPKRLFSSIFNIGIKQRCKFLTPTHLLCWYDRSLQYKQKQSFILQTWGHMAPGFGSKSCIIDTFITLV